MAVVDSSVWVEFFRASTPTPVRRLVEPYVRARDVALCEPVVFEILRAAPAVQRSAIETLFRLLPVLDTPGSLWRDACRLGQKCAQAGLAVGGMDLLIAQVCLHHATRLVTLDRQFEQIASIVALNVHLLERPA
jgi:predicted nucleic acid-binding protein